MRRTILKPKSFSHFSVANKWLGASDVQLIYEALYRPHNHCLVPLINQLQKALFLTLWAFLVDICFYAFFFFTLFSTFGFLHKPSEQSKFRTRDGCCVAHTITSKIRELQNNARRKLFHHFNSRNILWQQLNSKRNIKETILNASETE